MTVAALLASIAAFVPVTPGVTVLRAPCPDYAPSPGVSCAGSRTQTIYLAPGVRGSMTRVVLAHELGHLWAAQHLDEASQARYAGLLGLDGDRWLGGFDPTDPAATPPAGERFADAYALCALGPRGRRAWRVVDTINPDGSYFGLYGEALPHQIVADTCWWLRHPPAATSRR